MEIIFAGFGGQGVLTSGLVTAYIAMKHEYEVLWTPAYGGQMRGGKAYSVVKIEKTPIAEPLISKLDILVAMNKPSLDFVKDLKPDGILIVNTDMVNEDVTIDTPAKIVRVPIQHLAEQAGNLLSANLVSIGNLLKLTNLFDLEKSKEIVCEFFRNKGKDRFNEINLKALQAGYDYIET